MNWTKQYLGHLDCCYAVSQIAIGAQGRFLFATDDHGACVEIDSKTGEQVTVWDEPGGTMSIVPIPGTEGEFLASRRFFPGFTAKHAEIVRASRDENGWNVEKWMDLPYVHRFDLLEEGGMKWFLGCILTGTDREQADFENPGYLVVGKVSDFRVSPQTLIALPGEMHKNHGYCRKNVLGETWILTACEEGVFRLFPPQKADEAWRVVHLTNEPASDVTVCDLDGDGHAELVVIAPFHGDSLLVYRETAGEYAFEAQIPHASGFLHAIWSGEIGGHPVALIGGRSGEKELLAIWYENGTYRTCVCEKGYGASNICVAGDTVLIANREAGECAAFRLKSEQDCCVRPLRVGTRAGNGSQGSRGKRS